jgi:hypothetical protein
MHGCEAGSIPCLFLALLGPGGLGKNSVSGNCQEGLNIFKGSSSMHFSRFFVAFQKIRFLLGLSVSSGVGVHLFLLFLSTDSTICKVAFLCYICPTFSRPQKGRGVGMFYSVGLKSWFVHGHFHSSSIFCMHFAVCHCHRHYYIAFQVPHCQHGQRDFAHRHPHRSTRSIR